MIKKILPTMIGLALVGGMTAASADVTVFGHIDTSLDAWDDGDNDDINMNCTTCSIGFKGSEDLGNGLKAIFSLDFQYDTTERNNGIKSNLGYYSKRFVTKVTTSTSSGYVTKVDTKGAYAVTHIDHSNSGKDALFDRDQWLGLAGNFGQVRFGTISTHYKSHGAMIDPLYRTALQGRDHGLQNPDFHSGAGEELQGRATNTVRYDSPTIGGGFKVGAHYTFDSGGSETDDPFGIGGSYENGGILVFADYIDANGSKSDGNDVSAWKLGGKFGMDNWAVMGQYEDSDWNGDSLDYWHIAGDIKFGSNELYAGYGNADYEGDETDSWTIAGLHSLSKSTKVYAGYTESDPDHYDKYNQFSVGMKHKF